jgi:large subunit ribosomal protein L25
MTDAKIICSLRESLGSRASRRLRAMGRAIASLQADSDHPHVDLHFDEAEFHSARRAHAHLFDLEFDGKSESAIVRELQWDAFGDTLLHVEFKRVIRGQKTESSVPISFTGTPAGVLNHDLEAVTVSCIPSLIPDAIKVSVDGLEPGAHIKAADVVMPEGIELLLDPETEIAVISEIRATAAAADGADGADAEEGDASAD